MGDGLDPPADPAGVRAVAVSWCWRRPPGAERAAEVAEYVGFHLDGLHAHHSTEDELIWPALHTRAGLSAALIDRMEGSTRHPRRRRDGPLPAAGLAGRAHSAENAEAWPGLATTSSRLAEHLGEEERDVVPLIAATSPRGVGHLGKVAFSKFAPRQRLIAMGSCSNRRTQ